MDYKKTLNLPEMNLSVKVDPTEIEPRILGFWEDLEVYRNRQQLNGKTPRFIVHNPPSSACGHVCIDDALNMILQDMIVKYRLMRGFNVPHFPIWNCYTLDSELEALRSLKSKKDTVEQSQVQRQCQSLCMEYINLQKEQFQRMGIFAYWDKAILTSDPKYKARIIETFGELYEADYLHKDAKPTLWCTKCQTDLADTETEYRDYKLLSLYVKFPVIQGLEELGESVYMVVWTNTPWTLAANTAVIVNPDYDYVAVEADNRREEGQEEGGRRRLGEKEQGREILIMADNAVKAVMGKRAGKEYRVIRKMKGSELNKIVYAHPFLDRDSGVVLDKRVSITRGTGCLHATPRCNRESYASRQRQALDVISAVDRNGQLTEEAGQFYGLNVFDSSSSISMELDKRGCLLASKPVRQPYPHCLYCENPVIIRIADKWVFDLNSNNLRQHVLKAIETVRWLPSWGKRRASDNITNRYNWDVSRRRIWGIPAPVFYCEKCDLQVEILEGINASRNMIERKGIDHWLRAKPGDILSDDVSCSRCGGRDFRWETDVLGGQFVSALSYMAISPTKKVPERLVDVFLGGGAQNGDWFQLPLLLSNATGSGSPFRAVLIHGPVVNEDENEGSEADGPSVQEILDEFGVDVLRLWAISMDCAKRLKISHSRLELVSKVCRRVRNMLRFLLGNLHGYDPANDRVDYVHLQGIDRWALHRLSSLIVEATESLEEYQFHRLYRLLYDFSRDISSLYLNIARRRLYVSPPWSSSRRAIQTVIYEILTTFTRLIAPILPFTAEEIWGCIPGVKEEHPSVYLSDWPGVNDSYVDDDLDSRWRCLFRIRSEIYKALEKVRQEKGIDSFSQASIVLYAPSRDIYEVLDAHIDDLESVFMVSKVRLMPPDSPAPQGIWKSNTVEGLAIEVRCATGEKCERCWVYSDTVGTNEQYPTLCYQCIAMLEGGTYYI